MARSRKTFPKCSIRVIHNGRAVRGPFRCNRKGKAKAKRIAEKRTSGGGIAFVVKQYQQRAVLECFKGKCYETEEN